MSEICNDSFSGADTKLIYLTNWALHYFINKLHISHIGGLDEVLSCRTFIISVNDVIIYKNYVILFPT
jgi:hypothetical protein